MSGSVADDRLDELLDLMGDPVVEFELDDGRPIVRTVNPAFEEVFGYGREELVGASLNAYIVPDERDAQADRFDRRTGDGKHNTGLVTRRTADGPREFFYRGVPYERDGRQYGFAIYTDVTDERRYERHFQVIHRLLRHDLRNELQVISGAAELIDGRTSSPAVTELAETIVERSDRLVGVSDEASVIEEALAAGEADRRPVDVAALCRAVAEDLRAADSSATVRTEAPEELLATGVPWLQEAVEALGENALVHGDERPTVRVAARRDCDRVELAVSDDGPGIPRTYRSAVFEDDDITQLQHATGIGLWLVRWVVEASGGAIEYEETDGWTTVRLRLQYADRSSDASTSGAE